MYVRFVLDVEADPNELEQSDQVIPTDILNQIKALIECKEANDLIIEMDVTDLTKESRRAIHEYIKKYFGQKIVASTVTKENNKVLQFKKFNKGLYCLSFTCICNFDSKFLQLLKSDVEVGLKIKENMFISLYTRNLQTL